MNTISEEQVLHNELSFEINQELIHLMKRIIEIQKQNTELKDNWNKLKEWLEEEIQDSLNTWGEVYPKYTYENVLEQMQEIEGGMKGDKE
jgi:hypothetical protein